ncbi:helix-turn-helix domain-containing protein, partial [Rhodopirellula bahusiensis]
FMTRFCNRHGRAPKSLASEAMDALVASSWPGNVRQLRNHIERMVVTVAGDTIERSDLPQEHRTQQNAPATTIRTLNEITEMAERTGIESALSAKDFHREQTAKALGISVRTLHYKMNRYGLH